MCVCARRKQHRRPNIYCRRRADHFFPFDCSWRWGNVMLSVSANCEVRGKVKPCAIPCSVCMCGICWRQSKACKRRKKKSRLRREGMSRLQGCQVLLFFYNIVLSVLFLPRCIEYLMYILSNWSNFTRFPLSCDSNGMTCFQYIILLKLALAE